MGKLPALTRADRLLILAPHPDDEALATGGLLQRAAVAGAAVRIIFLTDGDKNPWPQRVIERRWLTDGSAARARWGALRRGEALASLRALGQHDDTAQFWSLPDQGLTQLLVTAGPAFIGRISETMDAWRPTLLVAPSASDCHPDHSAVGVAAGIVWRNRAESGLPVPTLVTYLVHGSRHAEPASERRLVLREDEVLTKRRAILCHYSQTLLSRGRFVAHAQPEEMFLEEPAMTSHGDDHPLRRAHWDEAGLRLEVSLTIARRLLGPCELHVLAEANGDGFRHLRFALPALNSPRTFLVRQSFFDSEEPRAFVKVKTGPWLYDAAGWIELAPGLSGKAVQAAYEYPELGASLVSLK